MGVARQIDMLWGDGVVDIANLACLESLVTFLDYCETNGLCTRVASNYGDSGTGFGTGQAGDNAWAYFEFDQGVHLFGVLVQATDGGNFGSAPGDPGSMDGASGLGIAMAVRADGLSPWGGTTDDDGADDKGDPVWVGGDDPPYVFPMANNAAPASTTLADYDHATSREFCAQAGSLSGTNAYHRGHFWANEDGLFIQLDSQNNGAYTQQTALGRYTPMSHMVATCTLPYFMIRSNSGSTGVFELGPASNPPPFREYGSRDGNGAYEGGILVRPADGVIRNQVFIASLGTHNATFQPNTLYPTDRYEVVPFCLLAWEEYPIHRFGLVGYCPIELYGYGDEMVVNEINAAATIAAFGATATSAAKMVVSWDGGAAPSPAGNTTGGPLGRQSFTP